METIKRYLLSFIHTSIRGYHCPSAQQPYWNTIYLDDFPDEELLNVIDHAYETVFNLSELGERARMCRICE